jgi:hypothetical protein
MSELLRLLVGGVFPAEPAILSDFHSLRVELLLLGRIVVTLLALGAG